MALHRQDSEVREKERLYEEERRKSKKFKESENKARRESRESWIARKQAEEKEEGKIIEKKILERCIIHDRWLRRYEMQGEFYKIQAKSIVVWQKLFGHFFHEQKGQHVLFLK